MCHNERLQFPSISGFVICISVAVSAALLLLSCLCHLTLIERENSAAGSSFSSFLLPSRVFHFFVFTWTVSCINQLPRVNVVIVEARLGLWRTRSFSCSNVWDIGKNHLNSQIQFLLPVAGISPLQNTRSLPTTRSRAGLLRASIGPIGVGPRGSVWFRSRGLVRTGKAEIEEVSSPSF